MNIEITETASTNGILVVSNDLEGSAPYIDYVEAIIAKDIVGKIVRDSDDTGVKITFKNGEIYVFQYQGISRVGANTSITSNEILFDELLTISGL